MFGLEVPGTLLQQSGHLRRGSRRGQLVDHLRRTSDRFCRPSGKTWPGCGHNGPALHEAVLTALPFRLGGVVSAASGEPCRCHPTTPAGLCWFGNRGHWVTSGEQECLSCLFVCLFLKKMGPFLKDCAHTF